MGKKIAEPKGATLNKRSFLEKVLDQKYIILAFVLPFVLLAIGFGVNDVAPFSVNGSKQILVTDFWQQYYPFYSDFQSKLQDGSSLLYSWGTGLGTNYIALMAYYLASPLNFFLVFFPNSLLREALTVILVIKISCGGMFFAMFLRSVFKKNDFSIIFFSLMYALCAFTMGYYWNIIWFDTFALLPLVIWGTVSLVTKGRYKLYVISLALSMLTNYYMGFFTCIFTAMTFFGVCIAVRIPWKIFLKKLLTIAGMSLIAIGISAIFVIPVLFALQNTHSAVNTMPGFGVLSDWHFKDFLTFFSKMMGNAVAFAEPTSKEGLPNIYCGFLCILLSVPFFTSKKVSLREKVFALVVLAILILSCIYKLPYFLIHGMHLPNMLPYRFSYLISFTFIIIAYRAFLLLKDLRFMDVFIMAVVGAVFVAFAAMDGPSNGPDLTQSDLAVKGTIVIGVVYILLFLIYTLKVIPKSVLSLGLCALVAVELGAGVFIGIEEVRITDKNSYPKAYDDVQNIIKKIDSQDDELFYRMESQTYYTINDSSLYGYSGASLFSSTANESVIKYVEGLGIIGWDAGNRYYYVESSPLTNTFLDLKYMICKDSGTARDQMNWTYLDNSGTCNAYKNNKYLSLGFMTKKDILDFDYKRTKDGTATIDPFQAQNSLFTKATGIQEDLFTKIELTTTSHATVTANPTVTGGYAYDSSAGAGSLGYNYLMPEDSQVYVYADIDNINSSGLTINNRGPEGTTTNLSSTTYEIKRPFIISAGSFKKGEKLGLVASVPANTVGNVHIYVYRINEDVFEKGYNQLLKGTYKIDAFETNKISGSVSAEEDGVMYTSIPYEKGWKAYVDGVETEISPICNAMVAVNVGKGNHTVTFKYVPDGFMTGLVIAVLCIAIFAAIIVLEWLMKKRGKVLIEPYEGNVILESTDVLPEKTTAKNGNRKKKKKK